MSKWSHSQITNYADDANLIIDETKIVNMIRNTHDFFDSVNNWFAMNKLLLNTEKKLFSSIKSRGKRQTKTNRSCQHKRKP